MNEVAVRFDTDPPDYSWMIEGRDPPEDLSLWVFNADMEVEDRRSTYKVLLPRSVRQSTGEMANLHFMMIAVRGLCVTLLSHPGYPVDHPLVHKGEAWELLHSPPDGGDLGGLPPLPPTVVGWMTP